MKEITDSKLAEIRLTQDFIDAARSGRLEEVEKFVTKGQEIDATDDTYCGGGWSALHYASMYGRNAIVEKLIRYGADLENRDKQGKTPLHSAAIGGQLTALKELLAAGANFEKKDNDGETALYYASTYGHTEVVKALIAAGSNIENKDQDGKTPLHGAAIGGRRDVVKQLIFAGADVGARTEGHRLTVETPLEWARQYTKPEEGEEKSGVVEYLEECAGRGSCDRDGWIPIAEMPALDSSLVGKHIAYNPGTGTGWTFGRIQEEITTPTEKTANDFNYSVVYEQGMKSFSKKHKLEESQYAADGCGSIAWIIVERTGTENSS